MDGAELTPATRRRVDPEPRVPAPAPVSVDDGPRLAALETAVRAIDVRLEYLERLVSSGFQEAASRSLVLAEADEERTEALELRLDDLKRRLDDVAAAVVALQPTIDAILDLQSTVDLVGGRLSDLLGGPSLTELMDRLDEIADRKKR